MFYILVSNRNTTFYHIDSIVYFYDFTQDPALKYDCRSERIMPPAFSSPLRMHQELVSWLRPVLLE